MQRPTGTKLGAKAPSAFRIGAPKCGTSSMAHYLGQHPETLVRQRTEVQYSGFYLPYTSASGRSRLADYEAEFADGRGARVLADDCVQFVAVTNR